MTSTETSSFISSDGSYDISSIGSAALCPVSLLVNSLYQYCLSALPSSSSSSSFDFCLCFCPSQVAGRLGGNGSDCGNG